MGRKPARFQIHRLQLALLHGKGHGLVKKIKPGKVDMFISFFRGPERDEKESFHIKNLLHIRKKVLRIAVGHQCQNYGTTGLQVLQG